MIVIALLIYAVKLLAGFLLTHLIWDAKTPKALTLKLFLGAGMGAGVSSLLYFLWSWLNIPDKSYPLFELILFLTLVFAVWRKTVQSNWQGVFSKPSKLTLFWLALLIIAFSASAVSLFFYSRVVPHGIYDAWDIWNVGARFVYLAPNHWLSAITQNAWDHADYPLLVTLNVADAWAIIGSNTTQVPVAFSMFFMLSFVGLIFSSLVLAKDMGQGVLAALLLASLAELVNIGVFQYADIQLAYFFLATAALFYIYTVQPNTRLLFLAGLFAGFSAWTKNEGGPFVVISLFLCLLLSFKEKKNLWLHFSFGLLFPLVIILLFKSIAPPNDLFADKAHSLQKLLDLSRYQLILAQIWRRGSIFGLWPVSFFLLLIIYAIIQLKPALAKWQSWLPLGLFALQVIGYFVIYLLTPHDLYWHLNTSLNRLIFHVTPVFLFWLFTVLPSPETIFAPKVDKREENAARN